MLSEQQTTGMLQFAGLRPADRAGYLEDVVGRPDLGGFNNGEGLMSVCMCVFWVEFCRKTVTAFAWCAVGLD